MKETKKLLQRTGKILTAGIFLALLVTGCWNGAFEPASGADGNVTVTIETAGRTLRPNDITNASMFDRIALEFTKEGDVQTLTLNKPQTSGSITLERGTWSISALGFIVIDGREYEAAQGSSSVTVSTGSVSVSISLQTGLFSGSPGVFSYDVDYPANVTDAVLTINPLNDPHGYDIADPFANTVNLAQGKTGSFEAPPGYYILNITAKIGTSMMAVWNELVHIYSGRETAASYTFNAADFTGTVALSGNVAAGELEGIRIEKAVVTAYGDPNFVGRIASAEVTSFSKAAGQPYYRGNWTMTVPGSVAGKTVYFRIEETLTGNRNYTYNSNLLDVPAGGKTGIELGASYTWDYWSGGPGAEGEVIRTVAADGTVTMTINETSDWWWYEMPYYYPAETNIQYAYEFEAWTTSGERDLEVVYIIYPWDGVTFNNRSKIVTISEERKTFVVLSDARVDSKVLPYINFATDTAQDGTFSIKLKSIINSGDYVLPEPTDGPRFSATAVAGGIHFKVNLEGLPDGITGIAIHTVGDLDNQFQTYFWEGRPDSYEVIYPYVEQGKEYTFCLEWRGGLVMARPEVTVTATGGRGELRFADHSQLFLIKEGNMLGPNKAVSLGSFDKKNIEDGRYLYEIVSGTSWDDPTVEWLFQFILDEPVAIDLLNSWDKIPDWADPSSIMGKTCFSYLLYVFTYYDDDIYPTGSAPGTFNSSPVLSTPFTYPNAVPATFTAEQHPEGVKLIVDLTKIPPQTTSLDFHVADWGNAEYWMSSSDWQESWGEFYGLDKVEIIYPFVQTGKTYDFEVTYGGTGTIGQATVTANAGIGDMIITNSENIGLIYNSKTQTMSLSEAPIAPVFSNSPKIGNKFWSWVFHKGHNWENEERIGTIDSKTPITSVVFDGTFNPYIGASLSEKISFVTQNYSVVYDGREFAAGVSFPSAPFMFPYFDSSAGNAGTSITRTAFDTNSNLYLNYSDSVWQGNPLYVSLSDQNWYNGYEPVKTFAWYIDGNLQVGYEGSYEQLSTSGRDPGMHYGLVVVTIDGTAFAKEFAFRVIEN